jgi:hypothetical protein
MSVLSLPRIFFTGFMCWDPATGNNNDYFPTYDDVQAALNWDFFKQSGIDITPDNYRSTFRPWAIENQTINLPPEQGGPTTGIPAEWNYFGGNGAYFVQYADAAKNIDRKSVITGGMIDLGKPVTSDPLVGTPVTMLGDPFGNPELRPPGRLVDNNPVSVYSSQVYYNSMVFGDAKASISAPRATRMQSRFINFTRNFNLGAAGGASVTWQTCFPAGPNLKINAGQSQLLAALQASIQSGKAIGVMVRFNTYLNLYFQNGYFNNVTPQPTSAKDLPALYNSALNTGNLFPNPCYSRVVGTIGPWYAGELSTCPEGRYLVPNGNIYLCNPQAKSPCWKATTKQSPQSMAVFKSANQASVQKSSNAVSSGQANEKNQINEPKPNLKGGIQPGVAVAEFDDKRNVLSIDVLNTFPEWFWDGEKTDFKDIAIGVANVGGFTQVATLPYAKYNRAAYENGGGIVDLPTDPAQAKLIRDNPLVFQAPSAWVAKGVRDADGHLVFEQVNTTVVMTEQLLTAQTNSRGIYLNEVEKTSFQISIKNKGLAAAGANVLIVKYNPPDAEFGPVVLIPADQPQVVNVRNGQQIVLTVDKIKTNATVLQAGKDGMVTVEVEAANPGFPVLVFYPYLTGQAQPKPTAAFNEVGTAMFATIRVLSFDDAIVDKFVAVWNKNYDPVAAWNFVYDNILSLYDMIFPVMLKFVPLGERQRVEAAIDQVLALVAPDYFDESTLAMPITRDLSRGKRAVLELWGGLVKKNYPPQPISKPATT